MILKGKALILEKVIEVLSKKKELMRKKKEFMSQFTHHLTRINFQKKQHIKNKDLINQKIGGSLNQPKRLDSGIYLEHIKTIIKKVPV